MKFSKRLFLLASLLLIGLIFLIAWRTKHLAQTPVSTLPPPHVSASVTVLQHSPDTGWQSLRPGLLRRVINLFDNQNNPIESIYIVRIDPRHYRFAVAYRQTPQSLASWQKETAALVVVNGGYFRQEDDHFFPEGLIIVDKQPMGQSYASFAGMLAATEEKAEVRWLARQPYDANEGMVAALQSFPLLVKPGGELGFPKQYEDNQQARRTVIAQDRAGWLLLLVTAQEHFTLHQLSVFLTESDLNLDIALNLDGGPSSGIFVANPLEEVSAQWPLPIVITVHAKSTQ